ncbi:MAG: hypothetical protein N2C12_04715, partial [Planctomycetales bacterium]
GHSLISHSRWFLLANDQAALLLLYLSDLELPVQLGSRRAVQVPGFHSSVSNPMARRQVALPRVESIPTVQREVGGTLPVVLVRWGVWQGKQVEQMELQHHLPARQADLAVLELVEPQLRQRGRLRVQNLGSIRLPVLLPTAGKQGRSHRSQRVRGQPETVRNNADIENEANLTPPTEDRT